MSDNFGGSWYNDNGTRNYPLVEGSLRDDFGVELPTGIINDLMLTVPDTLSDVGLLGLTIGPELITVVIGTTTQALASVAVRRNVQTGQPIVLSGLVAYTAGWIVFGESIKDAAVASYRFSTPKQFVGRALRYYPVPPVTSLGKSQSTIRLKGIVRLSGGNDLEIVGATRQIQGELRTVAVIRLTTDTTVQAGRNLLDVYKGPCGGRPEAGTCLQPGIQSIGGAVPDCAGNIDILFASPFTTADGPALITVNLPKGLSDICGIKPFDTDQIPGQHTDSCSEPAPVSEYVREFSYSSEVVECG